MICAAAYALAGCVPVDRRAAARGALIAALALLVKAVAGMRRDRMLREQVRRVRCPGRSMLPPACR
jgi:hypothetical protein